MCERVCEVKSLDIQNARNFSLTSNFFFMNWRKFQPRKCEKGVWGVLKARILSPRSTLSKKTRMSSYSYYRVVLLYKCFEIVLLISNYSHFHPRSPLTSKFKHLRKRKGKYILPKKKKIYLKGEIWSELANKRHFFFFTLNSSHQSNDPKNH